MLSLIHWKTRIALTTTAVHGLRNYMFSIAFLCSGLDGAQTHLAQPWVQILWRLGERFVTLLFLRLWFSGSLGEQEGALDAPEVSKNGLSI